MSRPLLAFVRSVGSALNAVVAAETTTGLGRANVVVFGLLLAAFVFVFAGPGIIAEVVGLLLDREPDAAGTWSRLLGLLIVAATGLGSLWILKTEAFTKKD